MSKPLIAIVGPTASGKSDLADAVALALQGEVISVDAMQVYRGMDIGTAKVPIEQRRVPLHMIDVADISQSYSAELFQTQARSLIDSLLASDILPVLCGGTGLYLNAVIDVMEFPKGDTSSELRASLERLAQEQGSEALYDLLKKQDPASAVLIHPHNVRRIIRALEMLSEGKSYAQQHKGLYRRKSYYDTLIFGLRWPRKLLVERINKRVDLMFEQGLVEEVVDLLDQGLIESLTSKQAIGYKEVLSALAHDITLDQAQELVAQHTRQYAKRQMTWFNKDERIIWIDQPQDFQATLDFVLETYQRRLHG